MLVGALDGLRRPPQSTPEIFWEVYIHRKRTSATFYERAPPVNIPARSISGVTDTIMAKIAILEMADLAALQP